jgi:Holliday junction resolvase
MAINSKQKGARGERQWRDQLREHGYAARRGQQFSGSPDSPDVICHDLKWAHFEVKCVEKLNLSDAMCQAVGDAISKTPIVAHKRNHGPWMVTMLADDWFNLLAGKHESKPDEVAAEEIQNHAEQDHD